MGSRAFFPTSIGMLGLLAENGYLTQLNFHAQMPDSIPETADSDEYALRDCMQWLSAYFMGKRPSVSGLPLKPAGTAFQKKVWELLADIPYGQCVSYGELAGKLTPGGKLLARAVGNAVGCNPLPIIIPCHRVIRSNGSLGGFSGGTGIKIKLLQLEGVNINPE